MECFDVNYREDGSLIVHRKKRSCKTDDVNKNVRKQLYENQAVVVRRLICLSRASLYQFAATRSRPAAWRLSWRRETWQTCLTRRRVSMALYPELYSSSGEKYLQPRSTGQPLDNLSTSTFTTLNRALHIPPPPHCRLRPGEM